MAPVMRFGQRVGQGNSRHFPVNQGHHLVELPIFGHAHSCGAKSQG